MQRTRYLIGGAAAVLTLLGLTAPAAHAMMPSDGGLVCRGHATEYDEKLKPTGYYWSQCNGVWMRFREE